MDFNALQHKLFELDPSDPAEDLRKLTESAGAEAQKNVQPTQDYVQESVEVAEGSLGLDKDYSVADFAALAGVTLTEAQKKGSAGQAKGKDPMPKAEPGRTKHPLKDKLVGEDFKQGWDNYNTPAAIGITNPLKGLTQPKKSKSDNKAAPIKRPKPDDWKSFLQQHTSSLQKIAADPMKRKQFDNFMNKMAETIEEENKGLYYNVNKRKKAGTSRSKDHPKAPSDKAWKDAAKTAKTESVESIKEMLYRKLNSKK